jgi:hypothetical protein
VAPASGAPPPGEQAASSPKPPERLLPPCRAAQVRWPPKASHDISQRGAGESRCMMQAGRAVLPAGGRWPSSWRSWGSRRSSQGFSTWPAQRTRCISWLGASIRDITRSGRASRLWPAQCSWLALGSPPGRGEFLPLTPGSPSLETVLPGRAAASSHPAGRRAMIIVRVQRERPADGRARRIRPRAGCVVPDLPRSVGGSSSIPRRLPWAPVHGLHETGCGDTGRMVDDAARDRPSITR